jgi:molecular chaperone DnaJ
LVDYYAVLGIQRSASDEEVKKAYRKLARRFHPDVNPGNEEAERRFKEIQEAYAVLADPEKRAQYDRYGSADGPSFDPFAGAGRGGASWSGPGGVRFDFGGSQAPDLGDLFSQFFGAQDGAERQPRRRRGEDQEIQVEIEFVESARGTSVVLPVQRQIRCTRCNGTGRDGRVTCPACHGAGVVITSERLRVKIPEGIGDGQRVRVNGKGAEGAHGGPPGDLFVRVTVKPHPHFRRDGDNVVTTVPITFSEAYRGGEIEIGTIHGPVRAKIPQGTNSGRTFRLRGKGLRSMRTRAYGDHLYTVEIVVPKVISPAGEDAAKRVAELYDGDPRSDLPRSLD